MKCQLAIAVASLLFAGLPITSTQAQNSKFNTFYSDIGGGTLNAIGTGAYSWIGGGLYNQIYSNNSGTISGGFSNVIFVGNWATIGGGALNRVDASFATVGGGFSNTIAAIASNSVIAGGINNAVDEQNSFIGGGSGNTVFGSASVVVGGIDGLAGGTNVETAESFAFVGAGRRNKALGLASVVPGGSDNLASGTDAFAAGSEAKATNSRSFVWGSEGSVPTTSTNANSFTVRASGGVRFITSATNLVGAILASGATSWAVLSDSNAKTDVEPINNREVLHKVAALPVTSWHYKHDLKRRYIGPMAQDFHAAFGLGGDDDKTIATLDTDGVTLAAIKGLVEELNDVRAENAEMRAELREMRETLSKLPPAP